MQSFGDRIAVFNQIVFLFFQREVCRLQHHQREQQLEDGSGNHAREVCAGERAGDGCAFEHHCDFQVGPSIAHECDAGAGAGRDHRDEARADRDLHRHFREHHQRGHDKDAAAEPRQRADKAGADRQREQSK